ncbi:RNA polymerase sigma factor [Curvibacter sp. AEP1-3]|uniref:RNA polymerase sigma factor n=1 Tax=Curvibacter sp. AEP1-3 TaxID=1844971 RepID=UPI000B3D4BD2|nr:RNA polymerase sigma factor [Curvibacter sp. AEP1-3]
MRFKSETLNSNSKPDGAAGCIACPFCALTCLSRQVLHWFDLFAGRMAKCALTHMNHPDPNKLKALLSGVARGERDAFQELYRTYYKPLYRFAYHLGPERLAEEIANEVFLKVLDGTASFKDSGQAHFFTWLCQVARNTSVDYFRKFKADADEGGADEDVKEELATEDADAAFKLEMQQDQEALSYCIRKLPTEQRLPLLMIYWGDASLAEVAAGLGCPIGTIKSRMSTARASLYQCVRKWIYGGRYGKSI